MSQSNNAPTYIKCGEVYDPVLPDQLQPYEPPIVLAEVEIDTKRVEYPCVQLKFSEFINFEIIGVNPKFNLVYRLVREEWCSGDIQILQEWPFGIESLEVFEADNIITSQPTVLNYCDCVDICRSLRYIYRLEITQIETHEVEEYGITNKSFIATVLQEGCCCGGGSLPYIKQPEVFNPVLPLALTPKDHPVILTQVPISSTRNEDICIFINFSGFVTSNLKGERFNNLLFRLVKVYEDGYESILNEWTFRRVFVNDTLIKEPIVYNYCECISAKDSCRWVYRMELVGAELSEESFYDITQKSMTAQVYGKKTFECGCCCCGESYRWADRSDAFMVCGEVCTCYLESNILRGGEPRALAQVTVDTRKICAPHILINYSQNFSFTLNGFNPKLVMKYRLIRKSSYTGETEVLESWTYKVAEVIGTQVSPITSVEPLILNYCDEIETYRGDVFTYIVELEKSITEDTEFSITPKEIVAIVS